MTQFTLGVLQSTSPSQEFWGAGICGRSRPNGRLFHNSKGGGPFRRRLRSFKATGRAPNPVSGAPGIGRQCEGIREEYARLRPSYSAPDREGDVPHQASSFWAATPGGEGSRPQATAAPGEGAAGGEGSSADRIRDSSVSSAAAPAGSPADNPPAAGRGAGVSAGEIKEDFGGPLSPTSPFADHSDGQMTGAIGEDQLKGGTTAAPHARDSSFGENGIQDRTGAYPFSDL